LVKKLEIKLAGFDSPESVMRLKENAVFIDEKYFGLNDEDIFIGDLLGDKSIEGFSVIERVSGKVIGTVIDVWLLPANDVWVVKTANGNLPLPVIDEVVKKVDKKRRTIAIDLLPGLEELIEKEKEQDEK
jgi:ribosomal 30S subunit maturation factor RimM